MTAYFTINHETIADRSLPVRKSGELVGIVLAVVLLCCIAYCQRVITSLEEDAAERLPVSADAAGANCDTIAVGRPNIGILLSARCLKRSIPERMALPDLEPICFKEYTSTEESHILNMEKERELPNTSEQTLTVSIPVTEDFDHVDGKMASVTGEGFICDLSGIIIGCDSVTITDGVLCIPSDETCKGIAAGALASLGEHIYEIYIPANITSIDAGAFDGLTELLYIEVHPDNPRYGSIGGILYEK
ncbi:MAG: hypothetical protein Q4C52_05630 [Eubacteriales bacterium]|nr:hypothetical protein [Eubacteriales bacterium]